MSSSLEEALERYPGLMKEELCGYDDLYGHRLPCMCTFHLNPISCHTMHATQWFD